MKLQLIERKKSIKIKKQLSNISKNEKESEKRNHLQKEIEDNYTSENNDKKIFKCRETISKKNDINNYLC